ncbi:MAG: peptidylprolyl isomerase [Bacteroidales bacterium]|nr:peptidylprolyl isomerase [Bacteroidales bacterium]
MRTFVLLSLIALLASACKQNSLPQIEIHTRLGNIVLELDTVNAPITAKNFLSVVKQGILNQSSFYRVVRTDNQTQSDIKIEVVQGGLLHDSIIDQYPTIAHETTAQSGIMHLDGVISMARYEPGTASTEFFICVGAQPSLDFGGGRNRDSQGFAAFGRVISGMDIVRQIQQMKDNQQMLIAPVSIINIRTL